MPELSNLKSSLSMAINSRADELQRIALDILEHPESGYREVRTSMLVADWLRTIGLQAQAGIAKTGIVATLDTGRPGLHVAVMGELDSLILPAHAYADGKTGAAHACGHHAQIGSLLTVAAGLQVKSVMDGLAGKISFMATPAEEYIELEYRQSLKAKGEIEFFGGKQEFIKLGFFDDIDIAMLTHTGSERIGTFGVGGSNNGMIGKTVQ